MKDTTEKSVSKSAESAAKEAEGPALSKAEGLGRLLGVIAHEIKNPLSTIKVNLRLVDEDLQDTVSAADVPVARGELEQRLSRTRRKIAVITKEAARLEQILDNFLRFADQTHPRLAPADVNSLVSDLFDFFLPQALAHSITMRQQLHKEPLVCLLDAVMFKQAILNLFINAQQALDKQGELMVRTSRDPGTLGLAQIRISDTGKGIPAERLEHIFEPYQSTKPEGSGLGLATVKKIIDLHKGAISVVSEPGKGTAFTISLPLYSAGGATPDE